MKFEGYNFKKIKDEIKDPNTILLDYDNSQITIDRGLSTELEKQEFYKAYIFDENAMYTCINFGDEIKMSKISKDDFDKLDGRSLYLKKTKKQSKFSKIKVNVGFLKEKTTEEKKEGIQEKIEVFQYAGLE